MVYRGMYRGQHTYMYFEAILELHEGKRKGKYVTSVHPIYLKNEVNYLNLKLDNFILLEKVICEMFFFVQC